ncbi:MAG: NnrS family protein [Methylococcales bacterium]|nr:NnrS family protein [Methylococcales bacterium]
MKSPTVLNYPLFALGFRAFFLLAGLAALGLLILWRGMTEGTIAPSAYFIGTYWHAHEMLLGYTVAVIAGFLLTAVSNWTGKITLHGNALVGLSLLWLYGRILPFYAGLLPDELIALVDFAFLPILTYVIANHLIRAKNYKNLLFVGLLILLMLGNGLIHVQMLGLCNDSAAIGVQIVLATIVVMILVIAGRVFPFFTEKGLKGVSIPRNQQLDILAVGSALVLFTLQLVGISGTFLALIALTTAILNSWRLASWFVFRIWFVPLLWVLYLGYGWLILGFILTAFAEWELVLPSLAIHAFTVGGIGILTLGMMARVSLGHTGRAMKASNVIVSAFVLMNVAALFRVILPMTFTSSSNILIYLAVLAWLAAFALFIFVYAPILVKAREDGKEG